MLERGGEGEAHAQAADQHPRVGAGGDLPAGNLGQGVFRAVHARVHQLAAVAALDLDDEVVAVLEQAQGTAVVGNRGGVEQDKTFHGQSRAGGVGNDGGGRCRCRCQSRTF
ncbi:hypothetical protein D3C72_1816320 [compost metagenome]